MNIGLKVQSPFSTFPLILFEGEEQYDVIKETTAGLCQYLNSIESGVKIGEEEFIVEKVISCDLM